MLCSQRVTAGSAAVDAALRPTERTRFLGKTLAQIWDTAGQEKYHSLAPMYYRGAGAAIVVYDITKMHSFRTLKEWINELQAQGPQDIAIAIAGNKRDLDSQRVSCRSAVCFWVRRSLFFSQLHGVCFLVSWQVVACFFVLYDGSVMCRRRPAERSEGGSCFGLRLVSQTVVWLSPNGVRCAVVPVDSPSHPARR